MKRIKLQYAMPWIACLGLAGCGNTARDTENYGDITATPGGIALVSPSEHQAGWGRSDCLVCHNISLNVHRRPGNNIDPEALNAAVRANGGSAYCLNCHGPNGL